MLSCGWLTFLATHQDLDSVLIGHFVHCKEISDLFVVLLKFHQSIVVSAIVAENKQICVCVHLDVFSHIFFLHSAISEATWRVNYLEIV